MSYKYMGEGAAETMVSALTAMELKIAANREAALAEVDSSVSAAEARLKTLVGTPLVAATAADMTNTEKLYIYTGSESGYTYGNWYYYDGTTWTSGGMYNSPELETDKTLSVIDRPADAKATGDEISSVKNALNQLETDVDGKVDDVQINGASIVENGVANVPVATQTMLGVAKGYGNAGINIDASGNISLAVANDTKVKAGASNGSAIPPGKQHAATFYGLAKAAGDTTQSASSNSVGTYTEEAKSAISEMLNGSVSVSGTTPTINALPGIRYVCGEVTTIDITLPESGIVDVVFESGSTPTVLTITPPTGVTVKWANGFDPTALDANTTYEINICDGLGVAVGWT